MSVAARPKVRTCCSLIVLAIAACGGAAQSGTPTPFGTGGTTGTLGGGGTAVLAAGRSGDTAAQAGSIGTLTSGGAGATAQNSGGAGAGRAGTIGGTGGVSGTGAAGASASGGTVATAAGTSGMPSGGTGAQSVAGDCSSLPPATDYSAKGPFADAKMVSMTGPSGNYTLFRPDTSLGKDGFKHPIATWGNGITTTPSQYTALLTTIASHGFVVIASNDTMSERPALSAGLDWLIEQNKSGDMQGKLDITKELAIGYSWGGGAAIDTANRPNIVATVSFHGMPPRVTTAFQDMHSPLLLFTSTGDTFVTASGYVTPNYDKSMVQTFYATLSDSSFGHTSIIPNAGPERGPAIAWLRFWACKDENARKFFYGDDCTLCMSPFTMPQRKNWH
jgi:hypothetical protein